MSKDPIKWIVWIGYMCGIYNLIVWLDASQAPWQVWGGVATVMFGSGALNALGYPFGPNMARASRRELWERAPKLYKEVSH